MSRAAQPHPTVILILGPTAVGKTALSIALATRLKTEIVYADSMAVYRGMDIGTAKPSIDERASIPHHLLDIVTPGDPFSTQRFLEHARPVIDRLLDRNRPAVVVGGTGLYIRALTRGLLQTDASDETLIRLLESRAESEGPESLHRELEAVDPEAARRIHPRDSKRIVRALAVFRQEGRPITRIQDETTASSPYAFLKLGLTRNRPELHERIHRRVDRMIEDGLMDETRRLLQQRPSRVAMQALGYKEMADHLTGQLTFEAAVEAIKTRTRQFAKRQMTWFNKEPDVHWIDVSGLEDGVSMLELIGRHLVQ